MADTNKDAMQLQENLTSDIIALCELIARIMVRCLKERNPQVMRRLSLTSQTGKAETGENHDAA